MSLADPRPSGKASTPQLVGREREQAILRDHLANALNGQGSLVLIGGEAGIGKTTLAGELCWEAEEQGARVLVGRCYDLSETPPYGPWVDLFARSPSADGVPLPDVFARRGTIGAVTSQAVLFEQMLDFLSALSAQHAVVLLLDDLHWADPASLDLFRFLARTVTTLPVLLLGAYRVEEVTGRHPLSALLPTLVREAHPERLDLHPLDGEALHVLLGRRYRLDPAGSARLIDYVQAHTEGNPFFLGELLRTLEEGGTLQPRGDGWVIGDLVQVRVPRLLRQVIDARVMRLGTESQRLLAVAAVIGQEVWYDLWGTVATVDDAAMLAAVGEAETAGLMAENRDGTGAAFTHALIRDAIYETVRPSQRRQWHRVIGESLALLPVADPDAVATHFQRAGDARSVEWLVKAGERAERVHALITTVERFATAADLLAASGADPVGRGWLLVRLAWCNRYTLARRGLPPLEEAIQLAAAANDAMLAACARYIHGMLLCMEQEFRVGLAEIATAGMAFNTLPEADRRDLRASGIVADQLNARDRLREPALWLAFLGRYEEAWQMCERALAAQAPESAAGFAEENAWRAAGVIHAAFGAPEEARAAYACARAINEVNGWHYHLATTAAEEVERVLIPYHADRVAERRAAAAAAVEAWRRSEGALTPQAASWPEVMRLPILVLDGAWDVVRYVAQTLGAVESGGALKYAARALSEVARAQGELDLAWRFVHEVLPEGPTTAPGDARFFDAVWMQRLAVSLALDAGELPTAHAWLTMYDTWIEWSGSVQGRAEGQTLWAQYHRQMGDREQAHGHAARALAASTAPRQPLALLTAHRLLGELDTEAARYEDAREHLRAALDLADACAAPYERALTLLARTDLHTATGDRAAAVTTLAETRALLVPLGARPALSRVDALSARLPRVREPATAFPAGLSAREVEVLRLIAAGKTNREIAGILFLSLPTANNHVAHILKKTNTANRAEAATFALRHGLV